MTADSILALLAKKHAGDVFVSECKDGPTQQGTHFRLDAWAMARSWANPHFYGYEIKITRSDFHRDDKMHRYLPLCSDLCLVCPRGLIGVDEVPDGFGLMWVAGTGNRLVTKLKAPHRNVMPPVNLLLYILMWRCEIKSEWSLNPESKADYWRKWLEDTCVDYSLGRRVSKTLRRRIDEELAEARRTAEAAKQKADELTEISSMLETLGVSPQQVAWLGRQRVKEALGETPGALLRLIASARTELGRVEQRLRGELEPSESSIPPDPVLLDGEEIQ